MAQLSLLTSRKDIEAAQARFGGRFANAADTTPLCTLGFPGGSYKTNVSYLRRLDLWHVAVKLKHGNRWWNAFGVGPVGDTPLPIIVEINPAPDGSRRCAGAFFRDRTGDIVLGHTGRVGGGRPGICMSGYLETVDDDQMIEVGGKSYIRIGPINGKNFLRKVREFVLHVDKYKRSAAITPTAKVIEHPLSAIERRTKYPKGESDQHKQLKELVANSPQLLGLGAAAETHIEYRFRTSNRADVMVELADGSHVVVEVELRGARETLTGAHQALAYRALMTAELDQPHEYVHAVLVAHEIPASTREFCERHDIRPVVLPLPRR